MKERVHLAINLLIILSLVFQPASVPLLVTLEQGGGTHQATKQVASAPSEDHEGLIEPQPVPESEFPQQMRRFLQDKDRLLSQGNRVFATIEAAAGSRQEQKAGMLQQARWVVSHHKEEATHMRIHSSRSCSKTILKKDI